MIFLVLLAPVGLMAFALLMERVERRLQRSTVSEQDVEEFLDEARPDEVSTFIAEGWTRALSKFRVRQRSNRPSWRARLFARGNGNGAHAAGNGARNGSRNSARNGNPRGAERDGDTT